MKSVITATLVLLPTALAWGKQELPVADLVLVDKSERKMWLITGGRKYRGTDGTDGYIAVGNREIEEIWTLVKDGTAIRIQR